MMGSPLEKKWKKSIHELYTLQMYCKKAFELIIDCDPNGQWLSKFCLEKIISYVKIFKITLSYKSGFNSRTSLYK